MPDFLFFSVWLKAAWGIFIYVTVWFLLEKILKKKLISFVSFGLGIVLCVWITFLWLKNVSWAAWIVLLLTSVSGLFQARLVFRAPQFESQGGGDSHNWLHDYVIFLRRGLLILIMVIPAIQAILGYATLSGLFYMGVFVWTLGFGLSVFAKVYYLSEVVQWLGICLISFTTAQSGWTIISPILLISLFLTKDSEKMIGKNFIKN